MLTVGDNRQHAGNLGYDDLPDSRYVWDDTVANHAKPAAGDGIVLWDKNCILGASIIDSISSEASKKDRLRCPKCKKTQIKERNKTTPRYRCYRRDCRNVFDSPLVETLDIRAYTSNHDAGWVDLYGLIDAAELREMCVQPRSIQSIRELRWDRFTSALLRRGATPEVRLLSATRTALHAHGHHRASVRVRRGQQGFRRRLLDKFGSVCAFTGPQPEEVLDAAHLYSYAEIGQHHEHGGLLCRKDLHRLYDLGLLAIEPESQTIDVAPSLREFTSYQSLHQRRPAVPLARELREWLKLHWQEHRGDNPQ